MSNHKINLQNAEHYVWGGHCDGWHLLKMDSLSVIQERVPPGGSEVRHYHSHAQQFFYVLAGTATLEADGVTHQLTAQEGLHIPPLMPHQLSNHSETDLIFLVISQPKSHGDRVLA